jgi:hypothetical protein
MPALAYDDPTRTHLPQAIKKIRDQANEASRQALRESARDNFYLRPIALRQSAPFVFSKRSSGNSQARSRALAIEESARNLELQLAQPVSPRAGIFLHPLGTNLYVRNYQITNVDPEDFIPLPPAGLRATANKLGTPKPGASCKK